MTSVYTGMNGNTGRPLTGVEHLAQSIRDILTTPIGTRVMRRDYGSRVPDLIDRPINQGLFAELRAAVADALARWEPRFTLSRIGVSEVGPGHIGYRLEGSFDGRDIVVEDGLI